MRTVLKDGDFTKDSVLNLANPETVDRLKHIMRKKPVMIAFWIPSKQESQSAKIKTVLLAEAFRSPYAHCELWLASDIAMGTVGGDANGTIQAYEVDKTYEWDIVQIGICSDTLIDELVSIWAAHTPYNARKWRFLLPHQWLVSDHYDAKDTRTWTQGITCSQFILLFLRRCTPLLANFDPAPTLDDFWTCDSSVCLPDHIMAFMRTRVKPFEPNHSKHIPKLAQ